MKLLKKIALILLVLVLLIFLVVRLTIHESRPDVIDGNAEAMAQKILTAVNKPAWDTLKYIKWTFPGDHHYVWDRTVNDALVSWDDMVVHLDMDQVDGKAYKVGVELKESDRSKAIQKAWSYWCNDSYWLSAPYKLYDKGTTRKVARDEDGKEGLLITYESGGVTPGDQYLWYLDESGLPTGYKMWVKIIPIGGVYASWENYVDIENAKISSDHTLSLVNMKLSLTNIAGGQSWQDIGLNESPIKL